MYDDTHCHLNHADFDADRVAVLSRARNAQIDHLLCIGYDMASSRRAVALAHVIPELYAAIGIHPESADEWSDDTAHALRLLYRRYPQAVRAYGEIGLDYHWDTAPRSRQQDVLAAQIAFARELSPHLPLIIHCRDAQEDFLHILQSSGTPAPIVMHCFTGNWDAARQSLDRGCYLGIGGVATYKKSDAIREAIALAPLDRLLLETDCPYLAPQDWRGKRNEPSYIPAIAQVIADAKNIAIEQVASITSATARALFHWS